MNNSALLKILRKYCIAKLAQLGAEFGTLTQDYTIGCNAGEQKAYRDILGLLGGDDE